jgi:Tol biopolymer transport system component
MLPTAAKTTPLPAAEIPPEFPPRPSQTSEANLPPPGNLHSPSLSQGGEFLAFVSWSNPLDGDFESQVYLYDTGRGSLQAVGEVNRWPALTPIGRVLAYEQVGREDQVYVYDADQGREELASISTAGEPGDGYSGQPDISADGRFVVFFSDAGNLDSRDRNETWDVYLHDRQAKTTVLVSRTPGGEAGNDYSESPVISADGSTIAFWSWASDLVPGDMELCGAEIDPQNCGDVFVFDRESGALERVPAGELNALGRNGYSLSLSADGRYLAFYESIFDRQTGQVETICEPGEALHCAFDPRLSADGRLVAYSDGQVWAYERETGKRRLVSADPDGSPGNGISGRVYQYEGFFGSLDLSPGGRWVVFSSTATNLAANDSRPAECSSGSIPPYGVPGCYDLYLHDLELGVTEKIEIASPDPGSL